MNETLKTLHSLRTIHGNFADRNISKQDLQTILQTAMRAANASARQSYSIIVLDDKNKMKKLGYQGDIALIFCVDYNRISDTAAYLGQSFHSQEIVSFVTGFVDTMLVAQTAAIAAKSLGIDSLFTNCIHRVALPEVYELLNLPAETCFPIIELVLGYAQQEPDYLKGRLSGKGIVHYGEYQRLTQAEIGELVAEYDDKEKHIGLIPNWEELGFTHYLDWFYEKWSGRISEDKQQEFYQALITAGFLRNNA